MNVTNVQQVEVLESMTAAPEQRVRIVVEMTRAEADELAAARIARKGFDLYAADCRPVAHAVADALVAAGMGGS